MNNNKKFIYDFSNKILSLKFVPDFEVLAKEVHNIYSHVLVVLFSKLFS